MFFSSQTKSGEKIDNQVFSNWGHERGLYEKAVRKFCEYIWIFNQENIGYMIYIYIHVCVLNDVNTFQIIVNLV